MLVPSAGRCRKRRARGGAGVKLVTKPRPNQFMNANRVDRRTLGDRLKSSLLIGVVFVGVWLVIALAAGGKSGYSTAEGVDRNGIEQHFRMLFDPEKRIAVAVNMNTGKLFDPSDGDIFLVRPDGLLTITVTSDGRNHRFDIDRRTLGQHVDLPRFSGRFTVWMKFCVCALSSSCLRFIYRSRT